MIAQPFTTLYVRRRKASEPDPFGESAVGDWGEPEEVPRCLFAPGAPQGIDADRPNGARIEATAYFPKGWAGELRGAKVSADGSKWLSVVGDPQRFPGGALRCPWDVQVLLETTEG